MQVIFMQHILLNFFVDHHETFIVLRGSMSFVVLNSVFSNGFESSPAELEVPRKLTVHGKQ